MGKKLVSLALALTLALTLVPAALAAGQFTDVADTSPYAASIAWAVEKQITNGTTPTTFGPGNTCTTSHILTFLWRANGRPGDEGDEKAAVTAWANSLDIDASDLNAPCTRANAVTYMWKAAGSPAPAETAQLDALAADAPYASAVSWAVEKGVTKGTSDTAFSPYDTCTRGQIVTFLCRQLDPEAAKTQPAAPAQPEAPAVQPDSPEAFLTQIQGVWRKVNDQDTTYAETELVITGNTVDLVHLFRAKDGSREYYTCFSSPIKIQHRKSDYAVDDYSINLDYSGVLSAQYIEKQAVQPREYSDGSGVYTPGWPLALFSQLEKISTPTLHQTVEPMRKDFEEQQAAVSKYATLSEFPIIPDFGAIYNVSMYKNPLFENPDWHDSFVFFEYDAKSVDARAEALFGSSATVFDMFDDYAGILKTCGFTEKSAKSISGDPITVYEKEGYSVQLFNASFNHGTYGYWQSPAYTVTIYFPKR